MYTDIFKTFNDQTEKTFGPLYQYNQLVAKNFTALTNLQLEAARQYADIGLAQLQINSQIKDVQGLVTCGAKQLETMTRISQQMMEDGKKLSELAQEFKAGLDELVAKANKA
ncbi:phasin family protein [Oceanimonas sp. CAM02]|uniref:phasin family protein n=1 Tax=Oceanimonas sp. CAM02 TaxID=3080336 RepID=UPI00293698DE|nr:phasin family protein [Oceanimonas sp. CAM02]MDV2858399.1 phasin family protein [Oceanimonas sp. CAM02]